MRAHKRATKAWNQEAHIQALAEGVDVQEEEGLGDTRASERARTAMTHTKRTDQESRAPAHVLTFARARCA